MTASRHFALAQPVIFWIFMGVAIALSMEWI